MQVYVWILFSFYCNIKSETVPPGWECYVIRLPAMFCRQTLLITAEPKNMPQWFLQLRGAFWVYWGVLMWPTYSEASSNVQNDPFYRVFGRRCWSRNAHLDKSWSLDFKSAVWSNKMRRWHRAHSCFSLQSLTQQNSALSDWLISSFVNWGFEMDDVLLEELHTVLLPVVLINEVVF